MNWINRYPNPLYRRFGIPDFFVLAVRTEKSEAEIREELRAYLTEKYPEDIEYLSCTTEFFYVFFREIMQPPHTAE